MKKFYFTFGSWEGYPYQSTYLVVEAESVDAAIREFRKKYPDKTPKTVNCADIYSENEWNGRVAEYYATIEPAEIIRTELATKWHRIVVLLENTMKIALDNCECFTNEYQKPSMLEEMGCTEAELVALGINVEEVFGCSPATLVSTV